MNNLTENGSMLMGVDDSLSNHTTTLDNYVNIKIVLHEYWLGS